MNRLSEIKARAEAATEGPWEYSDCEIAPFRSMEIYGPPSRPLNLPLLDEAGGSDWIANAEFIAHAREDVDRLLAAIEAVLELHQPYITRSAWQTCNECWNSGIAEVEYPCPTVTAIHRALEEGSYGQVIPSE